MDKFNELLKRSKRIISKNLKFSEEDAQFLYKLLREFWDVTNEVSEESTLYFLKYIFQKENADIATFPVTKSDNIQYYVCKYLVEHPEKLKDSYEKIKKEEERDGEQKKIDPNAEYNSNLTRSIRMVTLEFLEAVREDRKNLDFQDLIIAKAYNDSPQKMKKQYRERFCSVEQRKCLDLYLSFLNKDEYAQVYDYMKTSIDELYKMLQEKYIESILRISEKLDDFNVLERDNKVHHNMMRKLGIANLTYPYEEEEKDTKSIKGFFKRENIEKLDVNKLCMLNAFLINRYTKEMDNLCKTFFVVNTLNLWTQIRETTPDSAGKILINIDEKKLQSIYKKMNFLDIVMDEMHRLYVEGPENEVEEIVLENGLKRRVIKYDLDNNLKNLDNEIGKDYKAYFDTLLPDINNDLKKDFENYRILKNAILNSYKLKDYNILSVLFNLYQSKNISKNWGIILDEKPIEDSSMVLLGFDIEDFNMPIRLHVKKNLILDFLKSNQNTTVMPMYEGASDFIIKGKRIGTQVFMPLFMKQKKSLKEYLTNTPDGTDVKHFLNHIQYLKDNEKYPEHLKVDNTEKGKNKVKKVRPAKKYIDLITGVKYIEEKDGQLKEINQEEKIMEK